MYGYRSYALYLTIPALRRYTLHVKPRAKALLNVDFLFGSYIEVLSFFSTVCSLCVLPGCSPAVLSQQRVLCGDISVLSPCLRCNNTPGDHSELWLTSEWEHRDVAQHTLLLNGMPCENILVDPWKLIPKLRSSLRYLDPPEWDPTLICFRLCTSELEYLNERVVCLGSERRWTK